MVERRPPGAREFAGRLRVTGSRPSRARSEAPRTAIPRPHRTDAAPDQDANHTPADEPATEPAAATGTGAEQGDAWDPAAVTPGPVRKPRRSRGTLIAMVLIAIALLIAMPLGASVMRTGDLGSAGSATPSLGGGLSGDREYGYYTNRSYDGNRWDDDGAYIDPTPEPLRREIEAKEIDAPADFWDPWGASYGGVGRGLDAEYRSLSRFEPGWRDAASRAYAGNRADTLASPSARSLDIDPFDLVMTGTDIVDPYLTGGQFAMPYPYDWAAVNYVPPGGYSNPYLNRLRLDGYAVP